MLLALGDVVLRVVDNVIRADLANHVQILRAAYGGNLSAERLGDLHGKRANAARCPVDQNFLSGLDLSLVAQRLQRGYRGDRHGSGLLESYIGRLQHDVAVLANRDVLAEGAV